MKNLVKYSCKFQTLTLAEQLVFQSLQMQEGIILVVLTKLELINHSV